MAHGSLFLPNSIALKRQHLKLESLTDIGDVFGGNVLNTISIQPYLLPIVFGLLFLFAREARQSGVLSKATSRLLLALGTTIAHVELASLGWFYRYEAYLIALDVTVIAIAMAKLLPTASFGRWVREAPLAVVAATLAAIVGSAPLWVRALGALGAAPVACRNIYEQQVQSARFFAKYFPHDAIAINDIGAVAYYGDARVIDLMGLADLGVAKAKSLTLDKPLEADQMVAFTKDAPIALIYDEWFPHVPASWVRLGKLRIDVNHVCAFNSVSIYATSGEHVPRVLAALRDFAPSLPESVRREGVWAEAPPAAPDQAWRLDAGDALFVEVAGAPEMSGMTYVAPDGTLFLPKVGELKARGLTLPEFNAAAHAKMRTPVEPLPAGFDATFRLVDKRRCHVVVAGDVLRSLDVPLDCGSPAAKALELAGTRAASAIDPYLWRENGAKLEKIDFAYDPAHDDAARAIALRGGDIVYVPVNRAVSAAAP
jgi:protein involved in polysaccharide export with SLBB domain